MGVAITRICDACGAEDQFPVNPKNGKVALRVDHICGDCASGATQKRLDDLFSLRKIAGFSCISLMGSLFVKIWMLGGIRWAWLNIATLAFWLPGLMSGLIIAAATLNFRVTSPWYIDLSVLFLLIVTFMIDAVDLVYILESERKTETLKPLSPAAA